MLPHLSYHYSQDSGPVPDQGLILGLWTSQHHAAHWPITLSYLQRMSAGALLNSPAQHLPPCYLPTPPPARSQDLYFVCSSCRTTFSGMTTTGLRCSFQDSVAMHPALCHPPQLFGQPCVICFSPSMQAIGAQGESIRREET